MKELFDFRADRKKGFTLLELLVVIGLIALAAALAMVALGIARKKSRDSKRQADLKEIHEAIEFYVSDHRVAPPDLASLAPTYMSSVPVDPSGGSASYGYTNMGGSSYALGAIMEGGGQNSPLTTDYDGPQDLVINGALHGCDEQKGLPDEKVYCVYWP